MYHACPPRTLSSVPSPSPYNNRFCDLRLKPSHTNRSHLGCLRVCRAGWVGVREQALDGCQQGADIVARAPLILQPSTDHICGCHFVDLRLGQCACQLASLQLCGLASFAGGRADTTRRKATRSKGGKYHSTLKSSQRIAHVVEWCWP